MATTCQTVVSRAEAFSALNVPLTASRSEMLSRIRADQQALYATIGVSLAKRFQSSAVLTSTSGSTGRSFSVSSLTPPIRRVLSLVLADGRRVREVDVQDQDAKHAPRYYAQGLALVEVGNDWSTTTGTVGGTLYYASGPTDIDPDGLYTQVITLPDEWVDLLVLPLAMYLHTKDPGRDPAEYQALKARLDERTSAFTAYCATYSGDGREHMPE